MTQTDRNGQDRLRSRFQALYNQRVGEGWDQHWQELNTYVLPRSGRFLGGNDRTGTRGTRKHNSIYDGSAGQYLNILSAGMLAGMTSPARPWFRLETADPDLNKSRAVKVWCGDVTNLMLRVFARSNTYRALQAAYTNLGLYGTASMLTLEDYDTVIHHYPQEIGEFYLACNAKGQVDTLYREFEMTVGAAAKMFGVEALCPATRQLYDDGSLDKAIIVYQAVEPRADRDPRMLDQRNMAWRSTYWEKGAEDGKYLRDSGHRRFPGLCPRWLVYSNDPYGASAGMGVLGDIKQLQHQQLRKAEAIDFQTKPPLQVPSALKGREFQMFPGGITFTEQAGPGNAIQSMWQVQLQMDHLLLDIQDVRERIRAGFYADLFLMLSGDPNDQRMTATEVAERHEEKLLMLGPVLERLHNELLNPLIETTFDRLVESNALPQPPDEMQGVPLNIEFVSMLAQAQRAISVNAVDRFVGNLGAVAAFKPDVLDKFDSDEWVEVYADALGIEPRLIVPGDKVAVIRQERAAAVEQANQAEMMQQGAQTAQTLAKAETGKPSALTDIMNMFGGYQSPSAVEV